MNKLTLSINQTVATNLMLEIADNQELRFLFLGSLNPSTFR